MSTNTPAQGKRKKVSFYLSPEILDELDQYCQEEGDEDRSVIIRRAIIGFLKKARQKKEALNSLMHELG